MNKKSDIAISDAGRCLNRYFATFCGVMHDIAGFPEREMTDIQFMGYGGMPKECSIKEIMSTNGYGMIISAISERLLVGDANFDYKRIIRLPADIRLHINRLYFPRNLQTFSPENILDGFIAISEDKAYDIHALPLAFIWSTTQFGRFGYKPFCFSCDNIKKIQTNFLEKNFSSKSSIHILKNAIADSIIDDWGYDIDADSLIPGPPPKKAILDYLYKTIDPADNAAIMSL